MTMNRETTLSLRKFIMTYIIPMFTVALVLVLVSYLNDLREAETKQQLDLMDEALEERDTKIASLEERVAYLEKMLEIQE